MSRDRKEFLLPEGKVQISFSGGRTSGFMLHSILEANGGLPDRAKIIFANTGREHRATLDFVQECSERWSVPITWVENAQGRKLEKYRVVNHNSASRSGEPFEIVIRGKGYLPNQGARFCTAELKVRPARDYLVSECGWKNWIAAIGIRADEPDRVSKKLQRERWQRWFPLADAGIDKQDVTSFWASQPFDLKLQNINGKTPDGNCVGCFLKSEAYLARLAVEDRPEHDWWERMEALASTLTDMPSGSKFNLAWTRKELRKNMERQGQFLLSTEGALCQKDGGECSILDATVRAGCE